MAKIIVPAKIHLKYRLSILWLMFALLLIPHFLILLFLPFNFRFWFTKYFKLSVWSFIWSFESKLFYDVFGNWKLVKVPWLYFDCS